MEFLTFDLGIVDEAQRGRTLVLRVRMPASNVATVRQNLTYGLPDALRGTLAYLLRCDDNAADVDDALSHVSDTAKARLFAWTRREGHALRPFALDLIDGAAFDDIARIKAVLG